MDFTFSRYSELLACLKELDYDILRVKDYLKKRPNRDFIILRHDVDSNPNKSLKMAELENKSGLTSTYYFRYPYTFEPEIIKNISDFGHEIGYHYEVLSKAEGIHKNALELFEKELEIMRDVVEIKTVCMHGNSLSKHDNRELWDLIDYEKYDLLGEAYFSVNDMEIYYFNDTGSRWDDKYNLRDKHDYNKLPKIKTTKQLINAINELDKIYITTHSARWGDGFFDALYWRGKNFAANIVKTIIKHTRR